MIAADATTRQIPADVIPAAATADFKPQKLHNFQKGAYTDTFRASSFVSSFPSETKTPYVKTAEIITDKKSEIA